MFFVVDYKSKKSYRNPHPPPSHTNTKILQKHSEKTTLKDFCAFPQHYNASQYSKHIEKINITEV